MSVPTRSVGHMDDIDATWDQPLTGKQVAVWCVDLLEDALSATRPTERSEALIGRLTSVATTEKDLRQLLWQMAQSAALVTSELRFYIDTEAMVPVNADGNEKVKRACLAAKTSFYSGGTETRSPYKPSSEM
jgi:hypothetical protein